MSEEAHKEYKKRKDEEFYQKYPHLFPKGEPYYGFSCGYGWWPMLDTLCSNITDIIQERTQQLEADEKTKDKPKPQVTIAQVKEKFGSLRFYIDTENVDKSENEKIHDLINKVEEESLKICEDCGEPGERSYKGTGTWIKTICEKCKRH